MLKRQFNKYNKLVDEKGRKSKEAEAQAIKLAEAYCCFKLVPKHFDRMVELAREAYGIVRKHERLIMNRSASSAGATDVFRKEYVGNEISATWINKLVKAKKILHAARKSARRHSAFAEKTKSAGRDH